ncbi:rhomboid family intramembrane serine protease [Planomonospora parontospora subsp. parontospora]|uniref:Rhomboid family intramembrane serine protease n=2 Tax=Planomonospora parontospora TaxID=58119 RepID=A0AA37BF08_9ACTN|nr:rhomboid family intramembrane serine protease [Planomonospora parontospora]GGK61460.1 rhomboid family intramembrane serine protease [Planomonospora parontospora]GII08658.1 rhomboid family intramembrane serine protease [Planomonospora parontospora subsp. parontospora]
MTTQPPGESGTQAVPTCYRHPDRETYVRCQRCERPICPDCMRDAAVGFQCPECVAEGNKGVRQAQAVFGGGAVTTPYVTWGLLILNVLAYIVQSVFPQVVSYYGMAAGAVAHGEWWRLLTGSFLHSPLGGGGFSLTHILFNMLALYIIGPELERWLGAARFLALYLLSALGGSVAIYLLSEFLTVGASGAIYGMFGALFVIAKKLGRDVRGLLWLIGINVAITLLFPLLQMIPALGGLPGVSWQGHLGGLVTGVVVSVIMAYAPARNRTTVQLAGCAAVLLLLTATVVLLPPYAYDEFVRNIPG